MANRFTELAFTNAVKDIQTLMGSRRNYARMEAGPTSHQELTDPEIQFIGERDSFYMASISETGWPYVQHRGGPKGFVKVLSPKQIGLLDFAGNRQYVTVGNLQNNDRVSIIMVDYPNRARLKLFGVARVIDLVADAALIKKLELEAYEARVERGFIIDIEAYDWNCPQHITPRWTAEDIAEAVEPLRAKIKSLEDELAAFRG